jgi:hypothetical protein
MSDNLISLLSVEDLEAIVEGAGLMDLISKETLRDLVGEIKRLRLLIADAHRQLGAAWKSGDLPSSALNGETIRAMAAVANTVPQRSTEP